MCSRDQIDFRCERADLLDLTAVGTLVIDKDHLSDSLLLILIKGITDESHPLFIITVFLFKCSADLSHIGFSRHLIIGKYDFLHLGRRADLIECIIEFLRDLIVDILMFFLAHFCYDRIKEADDFFVDFVAFVNGFDHFLIGDLICACFDHDDFFSGGSDRQSKV